MRAATQHYLKEFILTCMLISKSRWLPLLNLCKGSNTHLPAPSPFKNIRKHASHVSKKKWKVSQCAYNIIVLVHADQWSCEQICNIVKANNSVQGIQELRKRVVEHVLSRMSIHVFVGVYQLPNNMYTSH